MPELAVGEKTYLGDGVYVVYDGWGWMLTTQRASGEHQIYIDGPEDAKRLAVMMKVLPS